MSNRALFLLRSLAAATSDGIDNPYLPNQLRFALELPPDGRSAAQRAQAVRAPLAALLESPRFLLEPMFSDDAPNESVFLVLAFPGVERTVPPEILFAMAAELRSALQLTSCEPDLGADVFVDPEPQRLGTTESAVVDAMCWVDAPAPPNKRWALDNIRVPQAWALSPLRGRGIKVAQPDTGITDHPEIRDANLRLADALNILEGGSDPRDPLNESAANPGHGTATGSVLASGEAGEIVGAAPNAELIPIRCLDDVKVFDGTPVAKAIDHARQVRADVISMSLGGTPSRSVRKAIRKAVEADMIVVAAAGNCVGMVVWPAQYDDVIAVGGTNIDDRRWKGSSVGGAVAIAAPAELVWRAERKQAADPPALVSGGQGTSFATALTAGVAALWLAHFGRGAVQAQARARSVRVQELFRAALRQTARRPADWPSGKLGAGIIDAEKLLQLPLAQIVVGTRPRVSDAEAFGEVLETAQGPGTIDPLFDWAAHGQEVASLVLADAKAGRDLSEGRSEARAFGREATEALVEAVQVSTDARLAALALRARRPARQPPAPPRADSESNERLIRKLGRPAGDGMTARESAQGGLAVIESNALMESVERRVAPALRGGAAGELAVMASGIEQLRDRGSEARLSREQRFSLEALVKLTERPALAIVDRDGNQTFEQDLRTATPAQLADLGAFHGLLLLAQADIERRLVSVGRIDGDGGHSGTGFVVAPDLIMTNRHVVETLAAPLPRAKRPDRWLLTREATIDFSPLASDPTRRFRISEVVFTGPDQILDQRFDSTKLDLALLRVETTNAAGQALPPVMSLAQAALQMADPNLVVCGYPAAPQKLPTSQGSVRMDVVDRLREIFGLRYGRKYLSPGVIEQAVRKISFEHDATTLGGNSGSCILRLTDNIPVCGLHFAGQWLEANYAHSLAAIRARGGVAVLDGLSWV